ncbi:hypothetical protein [Polaromonas sp.]|uniref:hypothetical protein n=1 Tax=Polaromonas sp. TaxID=1869339 RepID=UPI00181E6B3A|nr:hypothetical protein [Polaromonas sp.]NML85783.1 hypothetical protein [Polaromonas sp.]
MAKTGDSLTRRRWFSFQVRDRERMADLSHWDFAENFSGYDAAALILGLEPSESEDEQWRVRIVTDRMSVHYKNAINRLFEEIFIDELENVDFKEPIRIELLSVKLNDLHRKCELFGVETPLHDWLADKRQIRFEVQEFERYSIARWITQIEMKSVYSFDRKLSTTVNAAVETDIDPADLPEELHAANIAFRAVTNGYGDRTATFKNRLIDYLKGNFITLNNEAIQRIATVANPDKGRGRKKFNSQ